MNSYRIVQLYEVVRTAHLERARDSPNATTILYRSTRYDFDAELAAKIDLRKAGNFGSFMFALKNNIDVLEINEPLVEWANLRTVSTLIGNRLRTILLKGPRAAVVTYAIASMSPRTVQASLPVKARIKSRLQSLLTPLVWRNTDRIAFGTGLAQEIYEECFPRGGRWPQNRLIPALPTAAIASNAQLIDSSQLVFLGDLSERKGFPLLLNAWPIVRGDVPAARLVILGKGRGEDAAQSLADTDGNVLFHRDPTRKLIFATLESSKVLTLPSQPSPVWREQVGLPIVEGLSRGCLIVTTAESGLSSWLIEHGHGVVQRPSDYRELANTLVKMLRSSRSRKSVLEDLPSLDGREEAANWLYQLNGSRQP